MHVFNLHFAERGVRLYGTRGRSGLAIGRWVCGGAMRPVVPELRRRAVEEASSRAHISNVEELRVLQRRGPQLFRLGAQLAARAGLFAQLRSRCVVSTVTLCSMCNLLLTFSNINSTYILYLYCTHDLTVFLHYLRGIVSITPHGHIRVHRYTSAMGPTVPDRVALGLHHLHVLLHHRSSPT